MLKGIVKWFDVRKGFGFITDEDNIDYYYWMYHYVRVFLGDGDGIFLAEPDSDQEYGGKGK